MGLQSSIMEHKDCFIMYRVNNMVADVLATQEVRFLYTMY